MQLFDLLDKDGTFTLYWYKGEQFVAEQVVPRKKDDTTIILKDSVIEGLCRDNLFCLLYQEKETDQVYIFNHGYIHNEEGAYLISDDFHIHMDEKRVFCRFKSDLALAMISANYQGRAKILNLSYNGAYIRTKAKLELNDRIMLYDPKEERALQFIVAVVAHIGGNGEYGVRVTENFSLINQMIIKEICRPENNEL